MARGVPSRRLAFRSDSAARTAGPGAHLGAVPLEPGGRVIQRECLVPRGQALCARYEQRLGQRGEGPECPRPDGFFELMGYAGPTGDEDGNGQPDDIADAVQEGSQHQRLLGVGHEPELLLRNADVVAGLRDEVLSSARRPT